MHLNNKDEIKVFKYGDKKEFSEIINKYTGKIYSVVARIIDNHEDILDVLQNTFLKAYKSREKFKGLSSVSTYLIRIAINEAKQYIRHAYRLYLYMNNIPIKSKYYSMEYREIKKDKIDVVNNAIKQLPEKYKEVIILRDIEEFSIKETAKILNISIQIVKTRTFRGRLLLRKILEKKIEGL